MSIDNAGASGGSSTSGSVEQRAKDDASQAANTVQHDLEAVTEKAAEDVKGLQREAKAQIGEATDKAKSFASEQKDFAASQLTGVAAAISKVADELDGDQATTARYARDLAKNLDGFGREVEGKSVDELMGMAQRFGRTQPLAFLGAAALAGFVASRFAGASAQRRQTPGSASTGRQSSDAPASASSARSDYPQNGPVGTSAVRQPTTGYTGGGNV